jgi:GTP pyrophosphokinase
MNHQELESKYRDELLPLYISFASKLSALLDEITKDAEISIAQIEHRAKTLESFLGKIRRKNYADPFQEIKDFCGIRVITYYQDDVSRVVELINNEFDVDKENSVNKSDQLDVDEFGYQSVHLIFSLKEPRRPLPEWKAFTNLVSEIQIRSVLQHAWASISHKLVAYNSELASSL